MIAIIDYGMGNLRSVQKALEKVGAQARITQDAREIQKADKVILPGVGAMQPAMEKLRALGLMDSIREAAAQKPFLGICLGFQLLFEQSDEGGNVQGLGILKGQVKRLPSLKVPHMGWNQLKISSTDGVLFEGIEDGSYVYFCHSYYVAPQDPKVVATTTDYGIPFASAVHSRNIYGVQFHPEKSQASGLNILANFLTVREHV